MSDKVKVKLPREVAEAIERYWSRWSSEAHLKHIQLTDWSRMIAMDSDIHRILVTYAKEHPVEYMQALVNGYEVELTPEDKVREIYMNPPYTAMLGERDAYRSGVSDTLKAFGIDIPGVNANE